MQDHRVLNTRERRTAATVGHTETERWGSRRSTADGFYKNQAQLKKSNRKQKLFKCKSGIWKFYI